MKVRTADLSGFGGSYEQGVQKMLWLGVKWIQGKPEWIWDRSGPLQATHRESGQTIELVGVFHTGELLKDLEELWFADEFLSKGGMTGAMHQYAMQHLRYLHANGYRAWLDLFKEDRFYEVDLSEKPFEIEVTDEMRRFLEYD